MDIKRNVKKRMYNICNQVKFKGLLMSLLTVTAGDHLLKSGMMPEVNIRVDVSLSSVSRFRCVIYLHLSLLIILTNTGSPLILTLQNLTICPFDLL